MKSLSYRREDFQVQVFGVLALLVSANKGWSETFYLHAANFVFSILRHPVIFFDLNYCQSAEALTKHSAALTDVKCFKLWVRVFLLWKETHKSQHTNSNVIGAVYVYLVYYLSTNFFFVWWVRFTFERYIQTNCRALTTAANLC